jgi:hypothetical protein
MNAVADTKVTTPRGKQVIIKEAVVVPLIMEYIGFPLKRKYLLV